MDATCLCACDSLDTELCCSQECPGDQLQSWIGQNFFSKVHRFMISHSLVPNCRDDSQAHKAQHCRVELQRPKLYCSPAFRWRPARSMAASLTNKYWLLGQQEWFTNDSAGYRPHHLQSHVSFAVRYRPDHAKHTCSLGHQDLVQCQSSESCISAKQQCISQP